MTQWFVALTWNAIALSPHSHFQNHFIQSLIHVAKKKKLYKKKRRCIVALQTEDIKDKELHYMTKKVMNDSGKALPVEGNYGQSLDVSMKENRHIRSWKCWLDVL